MAHASRGRDDDNPIQLDVGATSCGPRVSEREPQVAGSQHGTHPVARHHSNDLALTRVEVGHQVRSPGKAVPQLQSVERVPSSRGVLNSHVELRSHARAQAREVPPFAVPGATVVDREPEGTQQVVLVGDTARRHDDGRDRVVHDLFLRGNRNAAPVAATPQLSDQLGAAPVQLRRRLLGRDHPTARRQGDRITRTVLRHRRQRTPRGTPALENSSSMRRPG
jgi:hypothetical protein